MVSDQYILGRKGGDPKTRMGHILWRGKPYRIDTVAAKLGISTSGLRNALDNWLDTVAINDIMTLSWAEVKAKRAQHLRAEQRHDAAEFDHPQVNIADLQARFLRGMRK